MAKVVEKTDRQPDKVVKRGNTIIKIYGPVEQTEAERQTRHQAFVRAVADCIRSQYVSSKKNVSP